MVVVGIMLDGVLDCNYCWRNFKYSIFLLDSAYFVL